MPFIARQATPSRASTVPMPFSFSSRGAVALVRWETPENDDFDALLAQLAKVDQDVGRPILVSLVAADAGVPRPETALAWGRRLPELVEACASIHKVFEGTGFAVGVKRSVLTGMILTARRLGASGSPGRWTIHGSLDTVLDALGSQQRADLAALAAQLPVDRVA